MKFFSGLYFWLAVISACIPAIIFGIKEKKNKYYCLAISLIFCFFLYIKDVHAFLAMVLFIIFQFVLIKLTLKFKNEHNYSKISIFVVLSLMPLILTRILPFTRINFTIGFVGISYITFKALQIIIEIKDGTVETLNLVDYILFMLFFPTLSSGPIDRSSRFLNDFKKNISKNEYIENLGKGIEYILQGLVYKIVISQLLFDKTIDISDKGYTAINLLLYMYIYGFYLFFDFAGYSLMAVGVSKIFGIETPMNFNKPFLAKDMKDFWNRWHITLSHWFRDFIFSRLVFKMFKNKTFKSSKTTAMVAYMVNMSIMGVWHGISLSYFIYGIYHGIILAITEYFQKTKFYKLRKNKKYFRYISIFVTFNLVMFGFLIFSGKFVYIF